MGHSPLGGLVMIGMMLLMLGLGVTGFLMEEVDYFWGADLPLDIHEFCADGLMALVGLHIAADNTRETLLVDNLLLPTATPARR